MKIAFYGSSLLSSLLEWRGDLLSRPAEGSGRLWPRDQLLRAGHPRPPAPSRHRSRRIGARSSSIQRPMPACAPWSPKPRAPMWWSRQAVSAFADDLLLAATMAAARADALRIWWDVDAPATLAEIRELMHRIRCARACPSSTWC